MTKIRDFANDSLLFDGAAAAPDAPAAGHVRIYARPDGAMYAMDAGGIETQLGGSGSVGPAQSIEATASRALTLTDDGKFISANHASTAITLTVPPNSEAAFPIDTEIHVRQRGAAAVTIAAGGGVALNQPAARTKKLSERYAVVTLKKVASDEWALFGDLEGAP